MPMYAIKVGELFLTSDSPISQEQQAEVAKMLWAQGDLVILPLSDGMAVVGRNTITITLKKR